MTPKAIVSLATAALTRLASIAVFLYAFFLLVNGCVVTPLMSGSKLPGLLVLFQFGPYVLHACILWLLSRPIGRLIAAGL